MTRWRRRWTTDLLDRWFRRLPEWAQGLVTYLTVVFLLCFVPLAPAWLALLIVWLARLSATWQIASAVTKRARAGAGRVTMRS